MCYSAQITADYKKYIRRFGAVMSIRDYTEIFWRRSLDASIKLPKSTELEFQHPQNDEERAIKVLIDDANAQQRAAFEQNLFVQRKRLSDAERILQTKPTRAAADHQRVATAKIEWIRGRLDDLGRTEVLARDCQIFPGHHAPVMVMEGQRLIGKPMRYQCRPAGKPAVNDARFPGTYNARRDNLGGFWKGQFGHTHGVMVADAFFENVSRHRAEGRELAVGERVENLKLEFRPSTHEPMLVACLWSHWTQHGEPDLWSFAAITDEPPPEVARAGHDRCIIPIKAELLMDWLNPDPKQLDRQQVILDDRARPHYEHSVAL